MEDTNVDLKEVAAFRQLLSKFFLALDAVYSGWIAQEFEPARREECLNGRDAAFYARGLILKKAPGVVSSIVPPPGISAVQFVASILEDVDKAWHLCRFVHVYYPSKRKSDPDAERIRQEIYTDMPTIRSRLWEAWRFIGHVLDLSEPVRSDASETDKHILEEPQELAPLWELQNEIPEIEEIEDAPGDWLSNKSTANHLGLESTGKLTDRRETGEWIETETGRLGVHDAYCVWRSVGKKHPMHYRPYLEKYRGQLAKIFPDLGSFLSESPEMPPDETENLH